MEYNPTEYFKEHAEDWSRAAILALCYPYHVEKYPDDHEYGVPWYEPKDWAEQAALIILRSFMDRRGIKWELGKVDHDIREEIVAYMAEAIRRSAPTTNKDG